MQFRNITIFAILFFILITVLSTVDAHSGRTDSFGGHHETATGGYHMHNGGNSAGGGGGSNFDSYGDYGSGSSGGSGNSIDTVFNSIIPTLGFMLGLFILSGIFSGSKEDVKENLGCLGKGIGFIAFVIVGTYVGDKVITYSFLKLYTFFHIGEECQDFFVYHIMFGLFMLLFITVFFSQKCRRLECVGMVLAIITIMCFYVYSVCYYVQGLMIEDPRSYHMHSYIYLYSSMFGMLILVWKIISKWAKWKDRKN